MYKRDWLKFVLHEGRHRPRTKVTPEATVHDVLFTDASKTGWGAIKFDGTVTYASSTWPDADRASIIAELKH
jgi:hypothetical protein